MPRTSSFRRTLLSRLGYVLFVTLLLFGTGELAVRIMGFQAWQPTRLPLEIQPGGSLFEPDEVLGYVGRIGTFDLTLDDTLQFRVTHNQQRNRITSVPIDSIDTRPEIWILGCSFTHGYGVSDEATYPYRLQQALPGHQVRNFSMSGYGTYHSLLQLNAALETGNPPKLVVLAYGDFHHQRNVNSRYWRKALSSQQIADGIRYPYLRYDAEGKTQAHLEPVVYNGWPGIRWSALVHYLEHAWNGREDRELQSTAMSEDLVRQVKTRSQSVGADFLLAGIFASGGTDAMLSKMKGEGMATLNLSQDTELPELRILRDDPHPNAEAHRRMADLLTQFLKENGY